MNINKGDLTRHNHVYVTEASTLQLNPGDFPGFVVIKESDHEYIQSKPVFNNSDLLYVEYKGFDKKSMKLRIYND